MTDKSFLVSTSSGKKYSVEFILDINQITKCLFKLTFPIFFIDKNIYNNYPELIKSINKFGKIYQLVALEDNKSLNSAVEIIEYLSELNASKETTLVAIGGGITLDLIAFVAHIYYRGLGVVFVPTTLLSMSDSCIGGKCGVNFNGFKNQLGAFHAPTKVLIWSGFLATLTDEALYSGFGEILKSMLIGKLDNFIKFKQNFVNEEVKSKQILSYIFQALQVKKELIEIDEFDKSERQILNYGHTFGHALELASDFKVPHGLAVVFGIDIANFIAVKKGILSESLMKEIHQIICTVFKLDWVPQLNSFDLLAAIKKDKKGSKNIANLILMEEVGSFRIVPIIIDNELQSIVDDYFAINEKSFCFDKFSSSSKLANISN